ncbi:hypothetical protein V8F20_011758 [Naviculisporaceae sp. PSN 640]
MAAQPNKRARADTAGSTNSVNSMPASCPSHSTINLPIILSHMTPQMHLHFLVLAATRHPDIMAVLNAWERNRQAQAALTASITHTTGQHPLFSGRSPSGLGVLPSQTPAPRISRPAPLLFEHFSDEVFDLIDTTIKRHESDSYDVAHILIEDIEETLKELVEPITTREPKAEPVSYETKRDAVEAIRDIYELVIVNTELDSMSRWMQHRGTFSSWGEYYLLPVLGLFGPEELETLKSWRVRDKMDNSRLGHEPGNGYGPQRFTNFMNFRTITWIEAFERMAGTAGGMAQDGEYSLGTDRAWAILTGDEGGKRPWETPY